MQIGVYSPREKLRREIGRLIEEFDHSACLSLNVRLYGEYTEMLKQSTEAPMEVLFFDTENCPDLKTRLKWASQALPTCSLALLGNDEKNAVFGYAVHAAEFLTFPSDEEEFFSTLARLLRERVRLKTEFIPVRIQGVWQRVNKERVSYVRSDGHNLMFRMDDGRDLRIFGAFREYEPLLDVYADYFRCHKSYMVNAKHVAKWDMSELTMDNGETVAISRPYRQAVRSFYAAYATYAYQSASVRAGAQ